MKKNVLMTCLVLVTSVSVFGQILKPVTWSYAAKKTSATEATVFIKATIDKSWHMYSQFVKEGGPNPTIFTFQPSKAYSLIGKTIEPRPKTVYEPSFQMQVSYFENAVIFQQKVKLHANSAAVKGKVEFMVCDDQRCLPPEEVEFTIPVK